MKNENSGYRENKLGDWMDEWCACKVCGGEIPAGHLDCCDLYKMECQIRKLENENKRLKNLIHESYRFRSLDLEEKN